MYRHLQILLLCCLLPGTALAQDAAQLAPAYGLNQLATSIADEPAPLRSDLARIALTELAAVYADEAARARQDMRRRAQLRELSTWVAAVEALAAEHASLADSLTPGTPVQIIIGTGHNLHLIVDGRPVVVSNPRMREQTAFAQRIITHFCALNRCDDLLDAPDIVVTPPAVSGSAIPQWRFSQDTGPVCSTADGLEFQFINADNLGQKREVCARIVAEMDMLAAAITREIAGGVRMDWSRLAIHPVTGGDEQVNLNSEGDHLRLPLPALAARTELFTSLRPWLAAKVEGTPYAFVVINAESRLSLPGQPLE
jgi:hypothetical protein